ncbi:MAG TPA: FAD:protein FMN transferase [Candidatus Limnocylindrales bacterium]
MAEPIAREGRAMGSPLRLQAMASARSVDRAWVAVVDEFEATEAALSRFRRSSEIELARRNGGLALQPTRRLARALTVADRARRITGGRFEPRVLADLERLEGEVVDGAGRPSGAPPGDRPAPGRQLALLERDGRDGPIRMDDPVDFGGIGKGLALRWAARRVELALGGLPFLLEAGGDLVGAGSPDTVGWRIGIEDPRGDTVPVAMLVGAGARFGVATSSVRLAHWRGADGRELHHLIDPTTGDPGGEGLLAVTVAATDPAWAEVWSKSLFLEGAAAIGDVARRHGLAAWWVTADGELRMTPAARPRTAWVASEAA